MRKEPGIESMERLRRRFEAHKDDAAYYTPDGEFELDPKSGKLKQIPVVGI